jgi:hypothetical protein
MEVIIMAFWQPVGLRRGLRARVRSGIYKGILTIFIAVSFIFLGQVSFAADISGKYQVVAGSDDKAYLVDTSTGAVWVLTYRTMGTGTYRNSLQIHQNISQKPAGVPG